MQSYSFCPFERLGVARNATDEQLKKAHREMALKSHPDKQRKPDNFDERDSKANLRWEKFIEKKTNDFHEIRASFEALTNANCKAIFLRCGRNYEFAWHQVAGILRGAARGTGEAQHPANPFEQNRSQNAERQFQEAERRRKDAEKWRKYAEKQKKQAERIRKQKKNAWKEAERAQAHAERTRRQAENARQKAEKARQNAEKARQKAARERQKAEDRARRLQNRNQQNQQGVFVNGIWMTWEQAAAYMPGHVRCQNGVWSWSL